MIDPVFANINKIIERDSKATTYKFALLRGVIEIIQDHSPYIFITSEKVTIPTGLLIEKWLAYYYPVMESGIPQINGATSLAFCNPLWEIIRAYNQKGGLSRFCLDIRANNIPESLRKTYIQLCRQIYRTITGMPMKHIGYSIYHRHYSVFSYEPSAFRISDNNGTGLDFLIFNFGTFSIPRDYFDAFSILGSFINGKDSILFKWAEFSVKASDNKLTLDKVINEVLKSPVEEREITESRSMYNSLMSSFGRLECVWSGEPLDAYALDHAIPFSVWRNNDLWNLLPSHPSVNNRKRDRIPPAELIENRKDRIQYYWQKCDEYSPERFRRELRFSLLGQDPAEDWATAALRQLQHNCQHLITERGYEAWKI
jgi:hypothetical protein